MLSFKNFDWQYIKEITNIFIGLDKKQILEKIKINNLNISYTTIFYFRKLDNFSTRIKLFLDSCYKLTPSKIQNFIFKYYKKISDDILIYWLKYSEDNNLSAREISDLPIRNELFLKLIDLKEKILLYINLDVEIKNNSIIINFKNKEEVENIITKMEEFLWKK
ncbi:hypothetical protein [Spiroplasma corruscae]|uniref:hypothetical protein n=1 Tax=Spiroplasma corruscae TaxID=216934 RepID=UPI000B8BD3DC|nr:hypothetical protein [Spiroplasma corruscae]